MIDEKKLIDEIEEYIDEYSDVDENGYHNLKWCAMMEALDTITRQPKVGEWIPVSEGVPDNSKYETYLCTLDGELCGIEDPFTGMCGFENGKWDEGDCVIAWQPMPEPWKGE